MNICKSIAYKNLSKNKKRTYTTIVGIILAVALICFIITIVYSLKKSMINAIKSTIGNYHINIQNISMSELLDIKEINNLIKIENFGISQTIGGATYETKNLSKQGILIEGYDNIALKNRDLHLLEGTLPKSENEILVSDYFISNTNEKITVCSKITLNVEKAKLNVKNKNERIIEQAGEEKITYTIVWFNI